MSTTGREGFSRMLRSTNSWLQEIMADAFGSGRQVVWHALGAVLRPLGVRVPVGLAAHPGPEPLILIRGICHEQRQPEKEADRSCSRDRFLQRVNAGRAAIRPGNARDDVRSVFRVLSRHADRRQPEKEGDDSLPEGGRTLWPEAFLSGAGAGSGQAWEGCDSPRMFLEIPVAGRS